MTEDGDSDTWMMDAQGYSMASSPIQRDDELVPYSWLEKYQLDDVKHYTGFDRIDLEKIYEKALQYLNCNKSTFTRGQALFISLWQIRTGVTCNEIAVHLKTRSNQTVESAVAKGFAALSKCFVPFRVDSRTKIPKASEVMLDNESAIIEERMTDDHFIKSRFIVDGRHHAFGRVPMTSNRKSYFSYKLHCPALSNMYIIDREGQCSYVSGSYPASIHDLTIYRDVQIESNAGLRQMIHEICPNDELYIQADLGYKGQGLPEIVTKSQDNSAERKIFNKYRLLVEQYFGRMSSKFVATRLPFRFKEELHDLFIRATAFLTNLSIELNPLRSGEENGHKKYILTIINKQKSRLRANAERVRRSRLSRVPKLRINVDMNDTVMFKGQPIKLVNLMHAVVSESTSSEEEKSNEQTKVNDELAANMDVCTTSEEEDLNESSIEERSVNSTPHVQGNQSNQLQFPSLRITEEVNGYRVTRPIIRNADDEYEMNNDQ